MKNIRHGVFETNSSSTHSISINRNTEGLMETLPVSENGEIEIEPGEFGWELEEYSDPMYKASYALTWAKQNEKPENPEYSTMLEKVIKDQTGAKKVTFVSQGDEGSWDAWGYIDHQSNDVCETAFEDEATLRDFIFRKGSYFETDNDNH